ncbi:MAG: hypothetical protein LUC24_07545, partial [Bacteroidales bacterium]|nr:hypothetical protein [Bacteroidales bacterium]
MTKTLKYILTVLLLVAVAAGICEAQNRRAKRKAAKGQEKVTVEEHRSAMMQYFVEGNDTVYIGQELPAARIFERLGRQRGKDWR